MNFLKNSLAVWYCGLSLFAVFGGSKLGFFDVASGLLLMWILWFLFVRGFSSSKTMTENFYRGSSVCKELKAVPYAWLAVISFVVSIFATYFYTGKGVQEVFLSLTSGDSLYMDYQKYFTEQGLAEFSISKIPAIFAFFVMKLILIISTVSFFIKEKKNSFSNLVYYILILCSYLYFSIARGTSFELFEILMLLWFCMALRRFIFNLKPERFRIKKLILPIMCVAAIFLYNYNIQARYSGSGADVAAPTDELVIDRDSIVYFLSEPLANLSNKLSGYFTFGLFFTSTFITHKWLNDGLLFITYLFPFSIVTMPSITNQMCSVVIDCGAAWQPDTLKIIESVGFIGLFGFVYSLGLFCKWLMCSILVDLNYNKILLFFYLSLGMISMPIGNFVLVSSANIILLSITISLFLFRMLRPS